MPVAEADLHEDLRATKEHASALGQQVKALKKELGAARDAADRVPELEAEKDKLGEALDAANREIASLRKALDSANARADKGDAAVAAGKAVADGLRQLGAI